MYQTSQVEYSLRTFSPLGIEVRGTLSKFAFLSSGPLAQILELFLFIYSFGSDIALKAPPPNRDACVGLSEVIFARVANAPLSYLSSSLI